MTNWGLVKVTNQINDIFEVSGDRETDTTNGSITHDNSLETFNELKRLRAKI